MAEALPKEVERPRSRPGTTANPRDRSRRFRPGWRVGTAEPKPTVNLGRHLLHGLQLAARRGTGIAGFLLAPSPLGDGSAAIYTGPEPDFTADPLADGIDLDGVEVPGEFPHEIDISGNGRSVIIFPNGTPDPFHPVEVPHPLRPIEIDTFPEIPQNPPAPLIEPQRPMVPTRRPPATSPVRSPALPSFKDELNIEFSPDGEVRIRRSRSLKPRWERPKKDGKYRSFYRDALGMINATWGAVSEVWEFMDAIAWNAYVRDRRTNEGNPIHAMTVEGGDYLAVARGIADGTYDFDVGGALVDVAFNEAVDYGIGRGSRAFRENVIDQGLWSGGAGPTAGPAI